MSCRRFIFPCSKSWSNFAMTLSIACPPIRKSAGIRSGFPHCVIIQLRSEFSHSQGRKPPRNSRLAKVGGVLYSDALTDEKNRTVYSLALIPGGEGASPVEFRRRIVLAGVLLSSEVNPICEKSQMSHFVGSQWYQQIPLR